MIEARFDIATLLGAGYVNIAPQIQPFVKTDCRFTFAIVLGGDFH
jgi:hypothetical protein